MQSPNLRKTARAVERWFARHQRPLPWRDAYDPYRVWVSEVMLQQTRMEVVLPYFERFVSRFPTLEALAAATDDEVMAAWSGLGYYRRAKMLRAGAAYVVSRHEEIPRTVEELMQIPGIGRYTAGAIASIAFDAKAPIVDGNVARVLSRVFALDGDAWPHATALVEEAKSPRDLNQGLMELGALICKPRNPSCLLCPVREHCVALNTGRVDDFPRAKPKNETQALRIPLYLVRDRRGRVLMHRASGALMDAMYHLPHGDASLVDGAQLAATRGALLGTFRHTVTTRRIEFVLYEASIERKARGFEWIDIARLHEVPHPSYVRKALRLIQ
ncbi:MAG TPA: A/G-specific adenine glycosylase [Thermoanaerobaculia bacterium]|nr:A/G-specific adenine glycosylase [Thermoanaerobaculia bacterium]